MVILFDMDLPLDPKALAFELLKKNGKCSIIHGKFDPKIL